MGITHYKDLIVWQKSIDLVDEIYKITKEFPRTEIFSLSSQMQRSAISIPSNIAEGQGRNHKLEFVQFLGISYGSSSELETQLIIAKKQYPRIDYVKAESLFSFRVQYPAALLRWFPAVPPRPECIRGERIEVRVQSAVDTPLLAAG